METLNTIHGHKKHIGQFVSNPKYLWVYFYQEFILLYRAKYFLYRAVTLFIKHSLSSKYFLYRAFKFHRFSIMTLKSFMWLNFIDLFVFLSKYLEVYFITQQLLVVLNQSFNTAVLTPVSNWFYFPASSSKLK